MKLISNFFIMLFWVGVSAQQAETVDFKRAEAVILFNQVNVDSTAYNSYIMTFDVLAPTDSIYLDAVNMRFKNVNLDKKPVRYRNDGKKLIIYHDFEPSGSHQLDFLFFSSPRKVMYFVGWENEARNQIWTQGQGKYTSNWLPSVDDMNDKIEFDISVAAPKGYKAIANGKMKMKMSGVSYDLWEYDMAHPMSSYLVALVIGKYEKKVEFSKSGIPLEMYYYPEDLDKFEPTYRYTKQMFDFLEEEIGIPYPWQNYKQVPVHDFLYAGMENTSLTIFADTFVTDSVGFVDRNYVNVNAHELAHQWFGNLVTETSGTHHWLHEGFASYYALLAEKEVFGEDYYYWRLYESFKQLKSQEEAGKGTSLLDPKSSSLTFYQKGAWALHVLREKVGDTAFRSAVKQYLNEHEFRNVETDYFIAEVEKASGQDLKEFVDRWLISDVLPDESMKEVLEENETTSFLLAIEDTPYLSYRTDENDDYIPSSLVTRLPDGFHATRSAVVKELLNTPGYPTYDDLLKEVFQSKDIQVRQALAQNFSRIPKKYKNDFEALLDDRSYATIEAALYQLWTNFPEDRASYLDRTKNIIGFSDKNVRQLWLALTLVTPEYKLGKKKDFYNELLRYSSDNYGYSVRELAFSYLTGIGACNDVCEDNLRNAATHHNWRLQKYAKSLLSKIE